jgi:hypothetical protein
MEQSPMTFNDLKKEKKKTHMRGITGTNIAGDYDMDNALHFLIVYFLLPVDGVLLYRYEEMGGIVFTTTCIPKRDSEALFL